MSAARNASIVRMLTAWFDRNARDLPWRRQRSGYTALVSEAMLQQTQVSRVVDTYNAFMKRFPTVQALAAADEQQVLAAWQGLGYYRRARNLHAAARMIVGDYAGTVPRDVEQLLQLPGVGRYTAGAIASIVHGRPEPIVDGNVHRVLARLDGDGALTVQRAWPRAAELVAIAPRPGAFNEALMELGATICMPRNAQCNVCPLRNLCIAHKRGTQGKLPPPKSAASQRIVHHHAVVIIRRGMIYLEQRPSNGLWSNMWQTPTIESSATLHTDEIASRLPVRVTGLTSGTSFQHATTHRRITFHVFTARSRVRRGTWRRPDDVADLPLSNAHKRVLAVALDAQACLSA